MEYEKLAFQCLSGCGLAMVIYGAIIVGAEIGGLTQGYPGKGREIHELVMKSLKQMFLGNKNNRKK